MGLSTSDIKSILTNLKKKIRLKNSSGVHEPDLSKREYKYLTKCLKNNFISTYGPFVKKFENNLTKFTKSKFAIATINGTSAIHIALKILKIENKDEVLIPSLNFVASTNATLYCGATPHFIDVEENTLGVDAKKLEKYLNNITKIKNNTCYNLKTKKKIKAIIPTHLFGHPVNIKDLMKVARKFKLKIIEDAAEGIGSFYEKKHVGTFGDIGIISFNGNKTITTGGGGAIITNNIKYANKARHLITTSKEKKKFEISHDMIGYNYKMTNLHASIGCAQMERVKEIIKKKRNLFKIYEKFFRNNNHLSLFVEKKNSTSNYWLQSILLNKPNIKLRNKILFEAKKIGFPMRPVWRVLPELKFLKKFPKMNINKSKELHKRIINLPSSSYLTN